jgi:hypothetical protein
VTDAADGLLHLRQEERVFELAKARLKKAGRRSEVSKSVANQNSGNEIGDVELPAHVTDGEIPLRAGKDPSPLHYRDSRDSSQCINHAVCIGERIVPHGPKTGVGVI